ncbi:MAG TPA: hypothetical protein VKA69_01290 [Desulfobacteria bacterium]|nr:hypothetical protein [Desulfobacteria bacterium]
MEQIELEKDFPHDLGNGPLTGKPGTVDNPVDLEPYIDFLEEIEAFDTPKKKPFFYPAEFKL